MRTILFYLCFLLCLFTSCAKSPDNIQQTNMPIVNNVFYPVTIFGSPGPWGGSVCSWGYVMIREDSNSIVYHSIAIPPNTTIPNIPTPVKIQFHDTTGMSTSCGRNIVVDSIKF